MFIPGAIDYFSIDRSTIAVTMKLAVRFITTVGTAMELAVCLISTVRPAVILAIRLVPAVIGAHRRRPQRDGRKAN
jgi:hypothetical protein